MIATTTSRKGRRRRRYPSRIRGSRSSMAVTVKVKPILLPPGVVVVRTRRTS